jgi:DMSO/TMAO reductase YedYZ heme-binding membrane subunit
LGFWAFSPGVPAVFFREGYTGSITPFRVLIVLHITSFIPSVRKLGFLLFDV